MATDNPFSPTFGAPRPLLAGRDDILDDVATLSTPVPRTPTTRPCSSASAAPVRPSPYAIEDLAHQRGWLSIAATPHRRAYRDGWPGPPVAWSTTSKVPGRLAVSPVSARPASASTSNTPPAPNRLQTSAPPSRGSVTC